MVTKGHTHIKENVRNFQKLKELKIHFLFLANFIFAVSHLNKHPVVNSNTSKALTILQPKRKSYPPHRGVPRKSCSKDMQQIYRRTPTPQCDFNKIAVQLYWNHTLAWLFSCKHLFLKAPLDDCFWSCYLKFITLVILVF